MRYIENNVIIWYIELKRYYQALDSMKFLSPDGVHLFADTTKRANFKVMFK